MIPPLCQPHYSFQSLYGDAVHLTQLVHDPVSTAFSPHFGVPRTGGGGCWSLELPLNHQNIVLLCPPHQFILPLPGSQVYPAQSPPPPMSQPILPPKTRLRWSISTTLPPGVAGHRLPKIYPNSPRSHFLFLEALEPCNIVKLPASGDANPN